MRFWSGYAAALLASWACAFGCAMLARPTPETAARDAYRAAKLACEVYGLTPGEKHTAELDRSCRQLVVMCQEPAGEGGAR